jgi:hypothetical protein
MSYTDIVLPDEIVMKIMLYNSHPVAALMKEYWKEYHQEEFHDMDTDEEEWVMYNELL